MSLSVFQNRLQDIYQLDIAHNVNDYLITCKTLMQRLDSGQTNKSTREKLLIFEDTDSLSLSLYLDQEILDNLAEYDPLQRLDHHNVQEFCLALEGISHFTYLVWNASHDRSVTLMEMELQAEVDKFIMLMSCMELQSNLPGPGQLASLLFGANVYHADLSQQEQRRYRDATKYARIYCLQLEKDYFVKQKQNRPGLLAELRRFYRLTKTGKLKQISRPY